MHAYQKKQIWLDTCLPQDGFTHCGALAASSLCVMIRLLKAAVPLHPDKYHESASKCSNKAPAVHLDESFISPASMSLIMHDQMLTGLSNTLASKHGISNRVCKLSPTSPQHQLLVYMPEQATSYAKMHLWPSIKLHVFSHTAYKSKPATSCLSQDRMLQHALSLML